MGFKTIYYPTKASLRNLFGILQGPAPDVEKNYMQHIKRWGETLFSYINPTDSLALKIWKGVSSLCQPPVYKWNYILVGNIRGIT